MGQVAVIAACVVCPAGEVFALDITPAMVRELHTPGFTFRVALQYQDRARHALPRTNA